MLVSQDEKLETKLGRFAWNVHFVRILPLEESKPSIAISQDEMLRASMNDFAWSGSVMACCIWKDRCLFINCR